MRHAPPAVVFPLDNITGLQTARTLARHRVPVVGIAASPRHFCARTRACREVIVSETAGDALIACLETLGPRLPDRAVLFPCSDPSVLAVSRARARLAARYRVLLPAPDVVEMLMDKEGFTSLAGAAGLPLPPTFVLRSRTDAERAAAALRYPSLLKPAVKTPEWRRLARTKAFLLGSADELLSLYERCAPWTSALLAQQWVPGGEGNLYSCHGYFDAASRPVATFVSRKIRQWPVETGMSCLGVECRNDAVLELAVRLFAGAELHGLGFLEVKRDESTGEHLVIGPSIGRPTSRSAIAEAGGVELLYAAYCDAAGLPLPAGLEQRYGGAKWIYLLHDLRSARERRRRGELTLGDWWRSVRGAKLDAVLSWRDPVPFLAERWEAVRRLLRRAVRFPT